MEFAQTIQEIRSLVNAARNTGKRIGLVPTMGALHIGHISLIEAAVKGCDFVVVSIFVNPTQFGPGEDFEKYPRPLEADLRICQDAGVDVVFTPEPEEMYPAENITWVTVDKLTEPLCGKSRPGHFRGVTTVCAKLFNIIDPDVAYFESKNNSLTGAQRLLLQNLASICGFKATSDLPQWMANGELDELRAFLNANPKITRTDRYIFQVDDRMVDFTSAVELPIVPKGLIALWGKIVGWLGDRYFILRLYKILHLAKFRKRGSIL